MKGKLKYVMTDMQHTISLCEFTTTTSEIPFEVEKVSYSGRGFAGSLTTGRELVSANRSNNRGFEGGFEESNIST